MKPRRILHISPQHDGGVAAVVDQLVRGINREHYEPVVVFDTHGQSNITKKLIQSNIRTFYLRACSDEQVAVSSIKTKKIDYGSLIQRWFGKKALDIYLSLKAAMEFLIHKAPKIRLFYRIIKENNIDLVHTHRDLHYGKAEIIAARLLRVPCITHIHGYSEYNPFDRLFRRFVTSSVYISNHVAEHQYSQGEQPDKGIVIHNGVEISIFNHTYDTTAIRKQFNVLPGEFLIGLIGRIDWWKGQDYFIEAINEVVKSKSNVKALIVGGVYNDPEGKNQHYSKSLESLVKSLKLENKIIFTGSREDIPQIISSLDIVIHASSEPEPFGLVVIEGMAAGKPVIATAAGGVLDIIEDRVNGLLVPCRDAKAMAGAIEWIISNRGEAERIGIAGRKRVMDNFTTERQTRTVEALYDSILETFAKH